MPIRDVNRILCEELRRITEEHDALNKRIEEIQADRRRLASVAHALLAILVKSAGEPMAWRILEREGLDKAISRLPALPGRKVVTLSDTPEKTPGPPPSGMIEDGRPSSLPFSTTKPDILPKGTEVEMLQGKFAGWTGTIRWLKSGGTRTNYTVMLISPRGDKARTQVTSRSLGRKWRIIGAASGSETGPLVMTPAPDGPPGAVPTPETPSPDAALPGAQENQPPQIFPRGTRVRVLVGKYANLTGTIGYTTVKGSVVTYTVYVMDEEGRKNRTQVNHGTLGKTWELLEERQDRPEPAPAGVQSKVIRRRPSEARAHKEPTSISEKCLPPGVLKTRTPVRMIAGHYLGYTGFISSVHARPGPGSDAIYTLMLTGPDGQRIRTTVKQASLGRIWVKAG